MPNYKGHLCGGIAIYGLTLFLISHYLYAPNFITSLEWLFFACAGALFPDVDTKSKGQKWYFRFLFILLLYALCTNYTYGMWFAMFCIVLPLTVKHRGMFHRIWFVVGIPVAAGLISCAYIPWCRTVIWYDTLFFILGALSHIWLDLGLKRMFRW
ncbi:MAG: metal-dependent hydrolase [Candidatus Dependentiae bacterium]